MKGWTDEEIGNKELRAPCGIFCGACAIYIATRENNDNFKAIIAELWGMKPEEVGCYGCMQTDPPKKRFGFCVACPIRHCAKSKEFYSCHQCDKWPCNILYEIGAGDTLPSAVKESIYRVMMRSIPIWRAMVAENGDERGSLAWARAECERYHCPSCGAPLFRSAQTCRACRRQVADELDGVVR